MRLLIITQKVDKDDPILGFFHRWIEEFAKHAELVTVICLEKGEYNLPESVKVLSLGKETKRSRLQYILKFYKYVWSEKNNYDTVFVHMNQEYVIMGGLIWKALGKRTLFWRNHRKGNILTEVSSRLAEKVFYTSPESYTAKFKNSQMMPVGIDLEKFESVHNLERRPKSILSLGRIAPVKNLDVLIDAFNILAERGTEFNATIVGNPDEGAKDYYGNLLRKSTSLVERGVLKYKPGVPNSKTPEMYGSHEIFVNMTASGSLDKTIFSAILSGAIPVVCNSYFESVLPGNLMFKQGDPKDLADKLELSLSLQEKGSLSHELKKFVESNHGLEGLVKEILNN